MDKLVDHIVTWLKEYALKARMDGFVIGISGGIDSAVTSELCAMTGLQVIAINLPIRQSTQEYNLANKHLVYLNSKYKNSKELEINLSDVFSQFEKTMPLDCKNNSLSMANSRSRLRMTTLYAVAQTNKCLVAGTGNKVEDYGVGFYTKYGDGGIDIAPIADLYKTEVWRLGEHLGVDERIISAPPTDGLWDDGRTDEDQIGTSYAMLEWVMEKGLHEDPIFLNEEQSNAINVYQKFHMQNKHKMVEIPTFKL